MTTTNRKKVHTLAKTLSLLVVTHTLFLFGPGSPASEDIPDSDFFESEEESDEEEVAVEKEKVRCSTRACL
jgi:hypothetical protein